MGSQESINESVIVEALADYLKPKEDAEQKKLAEQLVLDKIN